MAFRLSIAHLVCVSYEQVWKTRFAPANTRKTTKNRICTVSRAPKNMIKAADEKKKSGHACDVEVSEGPSVCLDLFLSEVFIVLVESILEEVVLAGGVTLAYNSGLLLHIYYYIINSDVI